LVVVAAAAVAGVQRCPGKLAGVVAEGAAEGAEVVVVVVVVAAVVHHQQPRVVAQTALAEADYVWKQSVY
jgi:hypothetical protein